jgi:hypothetical protein
VSDESDFPEIDDDALTAFEASYAESSGTTVTWMHEHGRFAVRCACGDVTCTGYAMTSVEQYPDLVALHRLPEPR